MGTVAIKYRWEENMLLLAYERNTLAATKTIRCGKCFRACLEKPWRKGFCALCSRSYRADVDPATVTEFRVVERATSPALREKIKIGREGARQNIACAVRLLTLLLDKHPLMTFQCSDLFFFGKHVSNALIYSEYLPHGKFAVLNAVHLAMPQPPKTAWRVDQAKAVLHGLRLAAKNSSLSPCAADKILALFREADLQITREKSGCLR